MPEDKQGRLGFGDVWTWTAIDADTADYVHIGSGTVFEFTPRTPDMDVIKWAINISGVGKGID